MTMFPTGFLAGVSPSARRHLASAGIGGIAGAGAAGVVLPPAMIAGSALLCATMAAIAVEDALRFRVPDPWVFGALVAGLVWNAALRVRSEENLLVGLAMPVVAALVCGGVFLMIREGFFRLRDVDGLGLGDVKLAAAGGAWVGLEWFPIAVLVAAVGAIGFVGVGGLRGKRWDVSHRLAFGAFLAPAIWAVWFTVQATGNG